MKARLILAESASVHPDGTVSILRAGIRFIWSRGKLPMPFEGCLVVSIESEIGDEGQHTLDLRCLEADGKPVMPTIQGQFKAPQGGYLSNILVRSHTVFQKLGTYTFYLRIDNAQHDTWTLTVSEQPKIEEKPK